MEKVIVIGVPILMHFRDFTELFTVNVYTSIFYMFTIGNNFYDFLFSSPKVESFLNRSYQ